MGMGQLVAPVIDGHQREFSKGKELQQGRVAGVPGGVNWDLMGSKGDL